MTYIYHKSRDRSRLFLVLVPGVVGGYKVYTASYEKEQADTSFGGICLFFVMITLDLR